MPPDPDQDTVPAVPVPIEEVLDLHPFHPQDIPSVVEEYLREAATRGFQQVRLIHGRGRGFQRKVVQEFLARHPQVLRFADAPPGRGGWGATLVWLKPTGPSPARHAE